MLSIRLSRVGKKKQPSYRVIVSDSKKDPWDKFLENLGTYNPLSEPKEVKLNAERIKYWISVGAQASATVHNILVDQKIVEGKKVKASSTKKKKKGEGEDPPSPEATEDQGEVKAEGGPEAKAEEKKEEKKEDEKPAKEEPKTEDKQEEK